MPEGMKLRSPWRATHIADPNRDFTMDVYDSGRRMPRACPVPLKEFVQYGEWFQRKAVPNLAIAARSRLSTGPGLLDLPVTAWRALARRLWLRPGRDEAGPSLCRTSPNCRTWHPARQARGMRHN